MFDLVFSFSGVEFGRPFLLGQVVHICFIVLALLWDYVASILLLIIVILPFVLVFLRSYTLEVQLRLIEVVIIIEIAGVYSILLLIYFDVMFPFLHYRMHVGFCGTFLFLVNIMQFSFWFFFWFLRLWLINRFRVISNYLELFNDVDGDGAQVASNQRHAAFLIARDKERAASTEAVAIMFTGHSIAAIHCAKHVARELSDGFCLLCFGKSF